MFSIAYHLLWTVAAGVLLPYLVTGDRAGYRERLTARGPVRRIRPGSLWIHALSVGEVLSAAPLVRRLQEIYPEKDRVCTVSTTQGLAVAGKELGANTTAFLRMPVDFWVPMERMIHRIRPSLFILVETDLWPGLPDLLRRRCIPSLLVNGRISPRTAAAYRRLAPLARRLFADVDRCLMQTELDRDRLIEIGVPDQKVVVVGNIKFDRPVRPLSPEERRRWERLLGLGPKDVVWVAGSTHEGEEGIVFRVFQQAAARFRGLRLILAPRRIERAGLILAEARNLGIEAVLRSSLSGAAHAAPVIVLDTLGELDRVYGLGHVSFVGGSLVPFGGHNLLEPAAFGLPVLFGPHTHNFELMGERLLESGGGCRVQDEEGLGRELARLLDEAEFRDRMGAKARAFVESNRGAVERVMSHVAGLISGGRGTP
jgi:3-deoxy-D-manno-octulosonic-acid transferase